MADAAVVPKQENPDQTAAQEAQPAPAAADFISLSDYDDDLPETPRKQNDTNGADAKEADISTLEASKPANDPQNKHAPPQDLAKVTKKDSDPAGDIQSPATETDPQTNSSSLTSPEQAIPKSGDGSVAETKHQRRSRLRKEAKLRKAASTTKGVPKPKPQGSLTPDVYLPKSVSTNPKYRNRFGKFHLKEIFAADGQPLPFQNLEYSQFVTSFLRTNKDKLSILKPKICVKAFSAYVTNYYSHVPINLRGPLLEKSKRALSTYESCKADLERDLANEAEAAALIAQTEPPEVEDEVSEKELDDSTEPMEIEDDDSEPGLISESPETPEHEEEMDEEYKAEVLKYYPQSEVKFVLRCLCCAKQGHSSTSCPNTTCPSCGEADTHPAYACPLKYPCTKCRQTGHAKEECPEKLGVPKSEWQCALCQSTDHIETECHWRWRSYRPEGKEIVKVKWLPTECFYCGNPGHLGSECGLRGPTADANIYSWTRANWEAYVDPNSTEVCIPALLQVGVDEATSKATRLAPSVPRGPKAITHSRGRDDDGFQDEPFIRPRVPSGPVRGNIRISNQSYSSQNYQNGPSSRDYDRGLGSGSGFGGRGDDGYRIRGSADRDRDRDRYEPGRYGRERSYSPPPAGAFGGGNGGGGRRPYHGGRQDFRSGQSQGPPPKRQKRGRGGRR